MSLYSLFQRIEKIIFQLLLGLVSIGVVILLILIASQVISRYFGIKFLAPPDEIITLIYVWMLFIGSALLVRNADHIKVEMLDRFLQERPRIKKGYDILVCLLIFIFLVVMVQSSLVLYEHSGTRSSPMLQLPQRLWYLSLLVSGFLMIFYLFTRLIKDVYELFKFKRRK